MRGRVTLMAATLALFGAALVASGPISFPLLRGWHVTFFPSSLGVVFLLVLLGYLFAARVFR